MYGPHARFRPHTPARPSFRCRTCGAPWPCQPARLGLLRAYHDNRIGLLRAYHDNRIGLLVYLAGQLQHALQDLPGSDPRELSARILYWLPPPGQADRAAPRAPTSRDREDC